MPVPQVNRFRGQIAGVGSTSGTRVVVGRWLRSPLGAFADAMVERPDGHRVLLAPSEEVRDFVTRTYAFDEARVEPVDLAVDGDEWLVDSPSLWLRLTVGGRMPLGWLLRTVPGPIATSPAWARAVDPLARTVLRGVRTRGTAQEGREESYGATDMHAVTAVCGTFDGQSLGPVAPVDPPCRFGFSSTPRTPAVTDVVTTVVVG